MKGEYDFVTTRDPRLIIDAGANIGLAAVFFANRYPEAQIVAVEPEPSNFELLVANTALYDNITPLHAALWSEDGEVQLVDRGHGEWAHMAFDVSDSGSEPRVSEQAVRAMSMDTLIRLFDIGRVDLLKLDIEGSERELFQQPSGWIDAVDSIVVELHEWLRAGVEDSFAEATTAFAHRWISGENTIVTREHGLLLPPS